MRLGDYITVNPESIKKDYAFAEIEYIDISSVGTGTLKGTQHLQLADAPSRAKRIVKVGDALLATVRPNLRAFWFAQRTDPNTIASTGFAVLRAGELMDERFLYYTVTNQPFTDYLTANAKGAAYPAVDRDTIERAKVYIPSLPIQCKIASILSAYDDLIEDNLRRIKILEEMAQALYREWFVKFRFPGHENVKFVDSPIGKIPEGWAVSSILESPFWEFIRRNIGSYEKSKIYFATADVTGIQLTGDGIEYIYEDKPSRAQKEPELNSVWFARMQETYKVLPFTRVNDALRYRCMLSSGFAGFKAVSEEEFAFLFFTINSKEFHSHKDRFCTGATQRSLTNEGLGRIQVVIPSQDLVHNFSELTGPNINEILILQRKNRILRQTRDLLLPKLISGELDVSELNIKIPEETS